MGRNELEEKILKEKVTRRHEIAIKLMIVISIIVTIWISFSWGEVVHHNDVYFATGEVVDYSPFNYFEIIERIGRRD